MHRGSLIYGSLDFILAATNPIEAEAAIVELETIDLQRECPE